MIFYASLALFWIIFQFLGRSGILAVLQPGQQFRISLYAVLLLSIFFLHLGRAYLQVSDSGRLWWIFGTLWLVCYMMLDFNFLAGPFSAEDQANASLWARIQLLVLILGWGIFMAGAAYYSLQSYLHPTHRHAKDRGLLWSLALIFIIPANAAFFSGNSLLASVLQGLGTLVAGFASIIQLVPQLQYDPRRILHEFSRSISSVPNLDLLATLAIGFIHEAMEIRCGYLFLVNTEMNDDGKNVYRVHGAKGLGEERPAPIVLPSDSILANYALKKYAPFDRKELESSPAFEKISNKEHQWISELASEVFVPVFTKEDWTGLLILGQRISGAAYTGEDLEFLSMLADQCAVAVQNVHLADSLSRLNNEFRRAYSSLERVNRELERLDRAKSDFISISSHELRTPLSVIRGYTEILIDEPLFKENPYISKMLSGIHAGILRLHEIVDSMLDMASIDTRSLELHKESISINVLVRLIVEGLKKSVDERRLNLEIDDNLRELPHVEADADALRKVFNHLITNAIKFTPDGGHISITGHELPADVNALRHVASFRERPLPDLPDGGVEIIISDTGVGIAAEFQELIFSKFYQTGKLSLHSTSKTKFKGAGQGLGLAIAKGIIEAHGGMIWVESPGHNEDHCPGSHFHVVLPSKRGS